MHVKRKRKSDTIAAQEYVYFTKTKHFPAAQLQNVEPITYHIGGSLDPTNVTFYLNSSFTK